MKRLRPVNLNPDYRHPYAHPKQPGSGKDEYGR